MIILVILSVEPFCRILSKFASYSHDRVGLFSQWGDDKDWVGASYNDHDDLMIMML